MFKEVVAYKKSLEKETKVISNFIQAKLWKTKYKQWAMHSLSFLVFIFFDDFQPRNPFGPSASEHKLVGVYISIPCLPPKIVSKMTSIFLHTIFYSKDRENYGNEAVFSKIIFDLNNLVKKGVKIIDCGTEHTLF